MPATALRFAFVSSNWTWGGSEELWSAAACELAAEGHVVDVFKGGIRAHDQPSIRRLRDLACMTRDLIRLPGLPNRLATAVGRLRHTEPARLRAGLTLLRRPDLVVVSQGGNHDGVPLADLCRRMDRPYVLIAQKSSDIYWPSDRRRRVMRQVYASALACFFVSEHNRRLTEEQLGTVLPHASVVRNPFLVPWEPRNDWPDPSDGIRLACVGRLYPMEKGQDLLLRVLARPEWRERPVSVTFYGDGDHRAGLEGMARFLGLTNVTFAGFVDDVSGIWNDHHALILPSRSEGLPLVVVEAMLSGRVPIVTNVGGSGEVIEDGVTGFIAAAPTEASLAATMERAWRRRDQWPAIATAASESIRTLVPRDPGARFAQTLSEIATSRFTAARAAV
jgi:glycosyltransferase involved in cell wall biosynthesis